MGLFDFFGTKDLEYPTAPTGDGPLRPCGDAPYQPPDPDGIFNKLFAPTQLPYPLPACGLGVAGGTTTAGDSGGAAAVLAAACATLAANAPVPSSAPAATNAPSASSTPTAPSAPAAPTTATPPGAATTPAAASASAASAAPVPAAASASAAPVPPSPVTVVINVPSAPAASSVASPSDASAASPAPSASPPAVSVASDAGQPVTSAAAATTPSTSASIASPPVAVPAVAVPLGAMPMTAPAPSNMKEDFLPQEPVILSVVSHNPRFRAHHSPAQESLIEEMIDETLNARMVSKSSAALAFVVPHGCDSVEFSYGPVELDEHGKDGDLDLVVTVGAAEIQGDLVDPTALVPGSALMVTIPWRAASFVQLPANHLCVNVFAKFFRSAESIQPFSAAS